MSGSGRGLPANLGEMLPSRYLKAQDLIKRDGTYAEVTVVISDLTQETIGRGSDAKSTWVLHFAGKDKVLPLNATNIKAIASNHGQSPQNWLQKPVSLFVARDVQFGDDYYDVIRIRKAPTAGIADDMSRAVADSGFAKSSFVESTPEPERAPVTQGANTTEEVPF